MTIGWLALALFLSGPAPAPTPLPRLTLKNGRVFTLKAPPQVENGRIIFTTAEGKVYSMALEEVKSFIAAPPTPTRTPRVYNPQDSRELGAIARQQRQREGKTTDLSAPRPAREARPAGRTRAHAARTPARKTPTPAPKPTPSPSR